MHYPARVPDQVGVEQAPYVMTQMKAPHAAQSDRFISYYIQSIPIKIGLNMS